MKRLGTNRPNALTIFWAFKPLWATFLKSKAKDLRMNWPLLSKKNIFSNNVYIHPRLTPSYIM
jgi:hypothetical protein